MFPRSPVRFQGISPNIHDINYTRKLEHKSEMNNPNQGEWKTWTVLAGPSWLVSREPLQQKTIYKIHIGLDFTCKWTEPWRSLLSYKGQKFILCLLQCNCTLLHCLGKTRLQERIPSPQQKHMKSVFKGIQK